MIYHKQYNIAYPYLLVPGVFIWIHLIVSEADSPA